MTLKDLLTWHDDTYAYHSPLQPKDPTRAEIDRLKTLVSELEDKVKELAKNQKSNEGCEEKPLIKDEKIRKAVRAWAEANDIDGEHCFGSDVEFDSSEHRLTWIETGIEFNKITGLENLVDGKNYTIAELCGEEEE